MLPLFFQEEVDMFNENDDINFVSAMLKKQLGLTVIQQDINCLISLISLNNSHSKQKWRLMICYSILIHISKS